MTTKRPQKTKDFVRWLNKQKHRDDPVGHIARDFLRDIKAPAGAQSHEFMDYILGLSCDEKVMDAARRVFQEFETQLNATKPMTFVLDASTRVKLQNMAFNAEMSMSELIDFIFSGITDDILERLLNSE